MVLSSKEDVNVEGDSAEELKVFEALIVLGTEAAAAEFERGVVEAKRTPGPFRFVFVYWYLVYMLEIDAPFFERSGLVLMEQFCKLEEN